MKILVISQVYYPEQFRINDICEELVKMGHDVTVLTGLPNYPKGELYPGYEHVKNMTENINGVKAIRVYERPRKTGAVNRFLNYYSFSHNSTKYVKRLDKDYDVVFINQLSPVMQAKAGIKYKKLFGKKVVLYCLDLWPASLTAGGIGKKNPVYAFYKKVSKKIYQSADKILISSKMFKNYFANEFKMNTNGIEYLPQYAEDLFVATDIKKDKNCIDLVFAGNIGKMQSVETIVKCANLMKNENVNFHIVGDGVSLADCKTMADKDAKITFYGQRPLTEMPQFYDMADAMLVTLKNDDLISYTLPGKVQTYMASGKPIIASGKNELKNVIEESGAGICVEPDDEYKLKDAIMSFCQSKEKSVMAKNARKYYEDNFDKQKFFEKLENVLKEYSDGNI